MPNAQCVCTGEPADEIEYEQSVTWLDKRPQPTWEDVEAARPNVISGLAKQGVSKNRQMAYQHEADPLYFGWQRGENTEQAWLDKVAEIRVRYPYPAE